MSLDNGICRTEIGGSVKAEEQVARFCAWGGLREVEASGFRRGKLGQKVLAGRCREEGVVLGVGDLLALICKP